MKNIVETAKSVGNFQTLLKAVQAAGLEDVLSGKGPYTVFAPNDEAFSKIPSEKIDQLLNDIPRLKDILQYHVVQGKVLSKRVKKMKEARTVQGQELHIDSSEGVKIEDANVIQPDIKCKNGVIHVIDRVIMPR